MQIDLKDLNQTINQIRQVHSEKNFRRIMFNAFKRAGDRTKGVLKKEIPKHYEAKPAWIGKQVRSPVLKTGTEITCAIPISGVRGVIGKRFNARKISRKKKTYRIQAKIMKGQNTTLPSAMKNQGGNKPFMIEGGAMKGMVFTRRTKKRFPIVRVVGLNVPRMPFNKAEKGVQKEILDVLAKRIEHEHKRLSGVYGRKAQGK